MTTLEQSKRLIELGVKKESADRVWKWNKESLDYRPEKASKLETADVPAWSINRLLNLLPSTIKEKSSGTKCTLSFGKDYVEYSGYDRYDSSVMVQLYYAEGRDFYENIYNAIVWVLENHKKTWVL